MKNLALFSCCLALASCGNWSNKDLEFLNAMPTKEQLRSKLPVETAGALKGEGTRRDALGVGEPSKLYADTKAGADGFNGILSFLLGALDTVRTYPPTTRSEDSRVWGPWDDNTNNPGFEARVVIKKVDDTTFVYAVQYRAKGGEYFDVVTGTFKPSATLRKGSGALLIHAEEAAAKLKNAQWAKAIKQIEIAYVTDMFPITVNMAFTLQPGETLQSLNYGSQELENKSGAIGFRAKGTDANISQLDVFSTWLASGAGVGVYTVVEGNWKGATHIECWDAAFKTVHVNQTWPGGMVAGDPADCVNVEGFPKP